MGYIFEYKTALSDLELGLAKLDLVVSLYQRGKLNRVLCRVQIARRSRREGG